MFYNLGEETGHSCLFYTVCTPLLQSPHLFLPLLATGQML